MALLINLDRGTMNLQEEAILEIDHATLLLVQAMEKYASELECCVDMNHLEALRKELVNLRRVLLGLEMGALYQVHEYNQQLIIDAVQAEKLPVNQMAAKVHDKLRKRA